MFDYLERLRLQPGHIRHRVAFGTAAGITAIVAAGWLAVVASNGTFALAPVNTGSDSSGADIGTAIDETRTGFSTLLGGAEGAFGGGDTSKPGMGIVVETQTSTTLDEKPPTVIPF
jgi:hypothetical protein